MTVRVMKVTSALVTTQTWCDDDHSNNDEHIDQLIV